MPIAKQREQVVERIDPCSACAVVDTVRVLVREGSSGRMGGATRKRCDGGIAPACALKLIFKLN